MLAEVTIADSIGIKLLDDFGILTGVGNELHFHPNAEHPNVVVTKKPQVLPLKFHGKICGIVLGRGCNADKLLVFGGREFMLVQWTTDLQFMELYKSNLTDWISTAAFLKDSKQFVLATAHSVLLHFEYPGAARHCQLLQKYSCADKSTLYCSHIHGDNWNDLVIFGGNAFGELFVWQPKIPEQKTNANEKQHNKLLQQIAAHNGVIFSINYNEKFNLLVTTSDDRSIKFWRVSLENDIWSKVKLMPLANGFGHIARVFQGKIIVVENQPFAITVGEDSYFCVWQQNGELLYKRYHQFGAVIWNFEFAANTQTIFTVGSTGNLIAYGLQDIFKTQTITTQTLKFILTDNKTTTTTTMQDEYISKIKFLNANLLVGISNKNRLVYKNVETTMETPTETLEKSIKWHEITCFDRYKCTALETFNKNLIALGGFKRLTIYKYETIKNQYITENVEQNFVKLFDDELLNGVVRFLHFLSTKKILLCDEFGNCLLLDDFNSTKTDKYELTLPVCKERCLTMAISISDNNKTLLAENDDAQLLLLSNRQGNLLLYAFDEYKKRYNLKSTLKRPHGHLGATVLQLLDVNEKVVFVRSAGRDNTMKLLCIDKNELSIRIQMRQIVPITWIVGIISAMDFDIFVGFNDDYFVGWSMLHSFTMQVPCGGGHRSWHYFLQKENEQNMFNLIFVKNKQIIYYKTKLLNEIKSTIALPEVRNTWHTKSCNIMKIIKLPKTYSQTYLLVSGGDDNVIKISKYNEKSLYQIAEIQTHISNIRALQIHKLPSNDDDDDDDDDEENCLIFSGGGRAQLCITKLNLKNYRFDELICYTLNTTDNEPSSSTSTSKQKYKMDVETRIMSIDVMRKTTTTTKNAHEFLIYLSCSDGYLRKIQFDLQKMLVTPVGEQFLGKCLLHVRVVADAFVLTAATDGFLKFYDFDLKQHLFTLPHHSSGVNALDVMSVTDKQELHIISGGDDQTVVYTKLKIRTPFSPHVMKTKKWPHLHSAQVTAVTINRSNDVVYGFTSGVDQKVFKLNLHMENENENENENETENVEKSCYSCVADVKGLCAAEDDDNKQNLCFIYGCGLQIFNFDKS